MKRSFMVKKLLAILIVLMSFIWIPSLLASEVNLAKVMKLANSFTTGCDKVVEIAFSDENYLVWYKVDVDKVIPRIILVVPKSGDLIQLYSWDNPNKMLDMMLDDVNGSIKKYDTKTGITIQWLTSDSDYPEISEVTDPAKREGIKKGDILKEIDGIDISKLNTKGRKNVYEYLQGQEGTTVKLKIYSKDLRKNIERSVIREKITFPQIPMYLRFRSLIYRVKGEIQNAWQDAKQAYDLNPEETLALGAMYLDDSKYDEAIKFLKVSKQPLARIFEATAYARQGRFEEAIAFFSEKTYEIDPCQRKDVFWKNAQNSLTPLLVNFVMKRTRSIESSGSYKDALNEYSKVLRVPGMDEAKEIWAGIGRIIKKNPPYASISEEARRYLVRAEALVRNGKFEDAVKEYRTAIKLSPFTPEIYFNSALVYGETKDYAEAIRHMNIYLSLSPDAPNARQAQDKVYEWEMLMEKEGK